MNYHIGKLKSNLKIISPVVVISLVSILISMFAFFEAREANRISQQANTVLTAPWVGVEMVETTWDNSMLVARFKISNKGASPAKNVGRCVSIYVDGVRNENADNECVGGGYILPDSAWEFNYTLNIGNREFVKDVNRGSKNLDLVFNIQYEGINGDRHESSTKFRYDKYSKKFGVFSGSSID